jgi:2-polyprenyl-6-methoxyphenol hydroxylase-like FAD-dependent oxidoreductase
MSKVAFGAALSLEDGTALALLLAKASSIHDIPRYLTLYDQIQRDRSEAIRTYSAFQGRFFTIPDGSQQKLRDKKVKSYNPSYVPSVEPSKNARYASAEWQSYMDDYGPENAVEEAIRDFSQSNMTESVVEVAKL